jgi:hypothetical protein
MMNDPNTAENGPLRPQVIDLDAEEIRTEPDTPRTGADDALRDTETSSTDQSPQRGDSRLRRNALWLAAALILGVIAGGWFYRGVLASYFPSNEVMAMQVRLDALEANGSGITGEIASLKQDAASAAGAAGTAGQSAEAALGEARSAVAGMSELGARLDALDQRIAAAETSLQAAATDLAQFRTSLSATAGAPQGSSAPIDTAALAALGQRLDALEKDVASLKSSAAQAPDGDKASVTSTLSQALSDLKAKVAAGTSYPEEYDRIARMVPAAAGLDTVGARAAEGLPNAEGLTAELRAAIPALPQPAAPPAEDNSYFGTLMKSLSGIVTIRPIGETDWPGVAQKAAAFAETGDLNQAIGVIDAAEGEKPMALTQWRDRAAARLQLEQAMAEVSEAVLRQIAALGGAAP